MKQFKRLVGLLLCLAMVLSILPATVISVAKAATTTTTDVLEKINLSGTAAGGCSQNGASVSSIDDLIWYHETTGHESWNKYAAAVDGSASSVSSFNCGSSERADWYLDLSNTTEGYTAVDQFILYAGGTTSVPTTKVVFQLEDGTEWEETFTTNWSSADDTLTYTFDETINATGMYVWQTSNTTACLGEIELYQYMTITYLDTANLNGVDLSEYKIVYSASDLEYAQTAAEYIQEQILLKTGRQLDVVTDSTTETTYEILVGETSRSYSESISAPSETAMKFTFASNGTKIAMKADYFIIAGAAYYFVETYIADTNFDITVNTGAGIYNTITKPANNYIMLIGDGMGVTQTEMFEYYDITDPSQYDSKYDMSDGEDIFYGYYFPYEGRSRTWNVLNDITDSGAGGTALATGYKTYNQHIGQNSTQIGTAQVYDEGAWQTVPVCQEVESLTELALRMGKSAAVMSTEETWGATPSSFSAHMYNRYEYEDIWADQDILKSQGVIFVDHDRYLDEFTAAEWEAAKPYYKQALETIAQDPDGFFMMYEEAYIDKECHNNRPDLSFMTMVRFNQAIAMFMEFAMYNPDTLVLITADHETGGLAVVDGELQCTVPNPNSSGFNHTLMEVPVFAYGYGAEAFDTNIVDRHDYYSEQNGWYHNTSIARTFGYMMGDSNFGDPQFPILSADYEPEPEDPNAPVLSALSGLATPEFGYYTDNNTDGALTSYYNNSYIPANLVDGDHSNQTRSQYYTYAEVTSGAKVPAIVFDLGGEKDIAAVEVDTYKATYYSIDNFDIQVYNNGTWTTVKSVTGAFSGKTHGEACEAERYEFTATTGTKVRILVTKLSDMTSYGAEDAEMATGSYIRLKEITIYEDLNAGASTEPTTPPATEAPTTATEATEPIDTTTYVKNDLTGTVIGVDSQDSATQSDYTQLTWYTDSNPTWKDTSVLTDGDYTNEIHWGLDSGERADFMLDLSNGGNGTTIDRVVVSKIAYKTYAIPTTYQLVLVLQDGSFVTKEFNTGWSSSTADGTKYTYDLDTSYTVTGLYVWASSCTTNVVFGEIELYYAEDSGTTDPTEPEAPTEPTTPAETEPAGETLVKIDLTDSVVGCDSQDAATVTDYTQLTWYSTLNPGWKDLTIFTDGDYSNEVHWGLDPHERADVYIDLTANTGAAVAVDQFKLYHSAYRAVGSVYFALILEDGTVVENTADLNWQQDVAADPFVFTYDQTYTAVGLYVWQPDNNPTNGIRAAFGEIELWQYEDSSTTEPTDPTDPVETEPTEPTEAPTAPAAPSDPIKTGTVLQIVPASKITSTPFGVYTDGTGADESTFVDDNDGYCVTDGWFGRGGYSGYTSADGLIALIMNLDEEITLGGMEVTVHDTSCDPTNFTVQAYVDGAWVTVMTQTTNAFSSERTVTFTFDTTATTSKVRVLVHEVSGGTSQECKLKEVVLLESTTGNLSNIIDLSGKATSTDANAGSPISNLVDGNKGTESLSSVATINLTVDGAATAIDGFNLYCYRGGATYPSKVTVQVQKIAGGDYETIGTYSTNWSNSYPLDTLQVAFDETIMAYSIHLSFDSWCYVNEFELFAYERGEDTILVGASYSIHLVEPWALRTFVQFSKNTAENLIPVSEFTSYGAYAIIGNKFDGTTADELMADADAVHYTSASGTVVYDDNTFYFDFYDGLYAYNLNENVYWVAYFVTAEGTFYTPVQSKTLTDVADSLIDGDEAPAEEKAILESMKDLNEAVVTLRGENADLGHEYAAGVANPGTLGDRNTGYKYGTAHKIRLIEPWGIRVRVLVRDKATNLSADYANADDYGLIFFHDKTGKYGGTMTPAQMKAETGALVYSKLNGNAVINAGGITAIYDNGIYTQDLDTELYCLPYIVVDGEYHYPSTVSCWNLLAEMHEFSDDTSLSAEERAVFDAMIAMYESVLAKNG